MLNSVKTAISKYNMLNGAKTVTVALSGGADSVALLHALLSLKDQFCISVEAAHLNHQIRGADADKDEAFVIELCKKLGVKLYIERVNVPLKASNTKESLELAARNIRYEFLSRVSSGIIATAHTANDNIETVLFNISRGAGLDGISGIPPKRGNIIRPLIYVTRQEVEAYCKENNLTYCVDKTNFDVAYSRNRIRHNVVTELVKVNDNAVHNVSRLCKNISDDADMLNLLTDEAYSKAFCNDGLDVLFLLEQHISIRRRMIAKLCKYKTGLMPEDVHINSIDEMCRSGGKRVSFKNQFEATVRKGILRIEKKAVRENKEISVDTFPFKTNQFVINRENLENTHKFNSLFSKNALDCDKICGELIFRHRKPGDSIRLLGRNVTKTLKKLFNESDMPAELRERLFVLSDDNGVLWVENFGVDERVLVDENTKCAIMINKF